MYVCVCVLDCMYVYVCVYMFVCVCVYIYMYLCQITQPTEERRIGRERAREIQKEKDRKTPCSLQAVEVRAGSDTNMQA